MAAMQFRVVEVAVAEIPCHTRVPFRFGTATLTAAPLLHARVLIETIDGRHCPGVAADLLVPKWFRKDPATTAAQDQDELRAAVISAAQVLTQAGFHTPFELWRHCYRGLCDGLPPDAPELLVRGFGVALLERALLDAVCSVKQKSFWGALQGDLFSFRPELVHPQLQGFRLADALPAQPGRELQLRHTVGMLDPLRARALEPAQRHDDGLPQALDEELQRYGIRWLKVKVGAGFAADRARLLDLAALCRELDLPLAWTLDGNEQFDSLTPLADLLDAVAEEADGRELVARLAYIEQPLPRARSFDAAANRDLERLRRRAPLLLDEADQSPDAFPRALQLGWRGTSVKNCKGVFRALLNLGICHQHGDGAFLSAEDLTTLPIVSLQQDLATAAALGLAHIERNGQHYFRGMDHLPDAVAQAALRGHADLYEPLDDGARLRVQDGVIHCGSLWTPGFACDAELHATLLQALPFGAPVATSPDRC